MLMKDGNAIPQPLAQALEGDECARTVFMKMRPSCQKRYAARVAEAKTEEAAAKRADAALARIRKYGRAHGVIAGIIASEK